MGLKRHTIVTLLQITKYLDDKSRKAHSMNSDNKLKFNMFMITTRFDLSVKSVSDDADNGLR